MASPWFGVCLNTGYFFRGGGHCALAGHRKIWVASGGTFTLPAQLTFVLEYHNLMVPGETTKILLERPWIAVYGYGCIVRVGTTLR